MFSTKFKIFFTIFAVIELSLAQSCDEKLRTCTGEIIKGNDRILELQKEQHTLINYHLKNELTLRSEIDQLRGNLKICQKHQEITSQIRAYTTNHCNYIKKLYDNRGRYLKSICRIWDERSYHGAKDYCSAHGMDLLIIEDENILNSMRQVVADNYPNMPRVWNDDGGLWVNGHRDGSKWVISKNGKNFDLPGGLKFVTEKSKPGDCFVLKDNNGFEGRNYQCSKAYDFYCEFASIY